MFCNDEAICDDKTACDDLAIRNDKATHNDEEIRNDELVFNVESYMGIGECKTEEQRHASSNVIQHTIYDITDE